MPNKRQPGDTIQNWTDKWVASVSDYSIYAISAEGRILTWNPGGSSYPRIPAGRDHRPDAGHPLHRG